MSSQKEQVMFSHVHGSMCGFWLCNPFSNRKNKVREISYSWRSPACIIFSLDRDTLDIYISMRCLSRKSNFTFGHFVTIPTTPHTINKKIKHFLKDKLKKARMHVVMQRNSFFNQNLSPSLKLSAAKYAWISHLRKVSSWRHAMKKNRCVRWLNGRVEKYNRIKSQWKKVHNVYRNEKLKLYSESTDCEASKNGKFVFLSYFALILRSLMHRRFP